jgi:hypothetical protein
MTSMVNRACASLTSLISEVPMDAPNPPRPGESRRLSRQHGDPSNLAASAPESGVERRAYLAARMREIFGPVGATGGGIVFTGSPDTTTAEDIEILRAAFPDLVVRRCDDPGSEPHAEHPPPRTDH